MLKKIEVLAESLVEWLGLEMIPIEFEADIGDDSRLMIKPIVKVVINDKYQNNYVECAKGVTHEMRHLFQIMWTAMKNDDRARRWKAAFKNSISSENTNISSDLEGATKYTSQEIELDALHSLSIILKSMKE